MTLQEKEDYVADFSKRFPSLSGIEMVERSIDVGPAGGGGGTASAGGAGIGAGGQLKDERVRESGGLRSREL